LGDDSVKPTKALSLGIAVIVATVLSFLLAEYLISQSLGVPVSKLNILVTLPVIGLTLVALAIPVIRYRAQLRKLRPDAKVETSSLARPKRVDPFYAVRLLTLAKACSIAASLFLGWHIGVIIVQLSRPVVAADGVWANGFGLFGSIVLLVCAIVVELVCRVPSDGDAASSAGGKSSRSSEAAAA
jgi:hypothetical protein